jgi:hypothetical protein
MQFTPQTEEQIALGGLLEEGLYPYKVTNSYETISKHNGNPYIALELDVFDRNGKLRTIKTNLAFMKLFKHFCDVNNMQEKYKSGNISDVEFMSKSGGLVSIGIEPEKENPKGGVYRAKNIVLDYVIDSPDVYKSLIRIDDKPFGSDDIPF